MTPTPADRADRAKEAREGTSQFVLALAELRRQGKVRMAGGKYSLREGAP